MLGNAAKYKYKHKQINNININKVFGISRRKFDTFYTEIVRKQLEILGEICTKA
jgi:hypothetical protein